MLKVEKIDVWGFEHAIRGMRNPLNSWDKSDSGYGIDGEDKDTFVAGKNDLELMQKLYEAGVEHRTYARMIQTAMDVTAPLYFWKEADRYAIGKTQISTSTMHTIHRKPFELNDFSHEHMSNDALGFLNEVIERLNYDRSQYNLTKDKNSWWNIIQLLPSSYNQKRTIMMSYEVIFKIIKERSGHKLDEWNEFVETLKGLPYVREIIGEWKC